MTYSNKKNSGFTKNGGFPRLQWVSKKSTMKDIHLEMFRYLRGIFSKWIEIKDPSFNPENLRHRDKPKLLEILIDFPYRPEGWAADKPFTKKNFDALSLEDAYKLCMKGILKEATAADNSTGIIQGTDGVFEVEDMPYEIYFKNVAGYYEDCHFCGQRNCSNCAVPFTEAVTVEALLKNFGLTTNDTFFSDD